MKTIRGGAIARAIPVLLCALALAACEAPDEVPEGPDPAALEGPVEVRVDATGVPHIYAESEDDLFFVQGYMTARDRMFEMDLLRRRAMGRRAEVLGEDYYNSDLQSRALRFNDYAAGAVAHLEAHDPAMYLATAAYAEGVNAFLADAAAGENDLVLAPQFEALGYEPEPWTAVDTMAIEKLLTAGLSMRPDQDIMLGLVQIMLGDELFDDFFVFRPVDPDYVLADFYDGMGSYPPASPPPPAAAPPASDARAMLAALPEAQLLDAVRRARELAIPYSGSNNWVVSGDLTADGYPIVASDTHQGVEHPATYYLLHLSTAEAGGELDVIGANFPGVPFVMFGHNQHMSWVPTTAFLDVSDAYLEKFVSSDEVEFQGEAVKVESRDEIIRVRRPGGSVEDAEEREVVTQVVPHHGPMMPPEALGLPVPLAISLRWTGYQERSIARTYYELNKASSWGQVEDALSIYFTGAQNFVYADDQGHIGFSCRADVPLRERLDPDVPPVTLLPGEGGYEWINSSSDPLSYEMLPDEWIPHGFDPPEGFFESANNDQFGQTDDNDPLNDPVYLSSLYDLGTRGYRIRERLDELAAGEAISFEDMADLQRDTVSRPAARLVPYLLQAAASRPDLVTPELAEAIAILEAWDLTTDVDDVAPSLFHAWLPVLAREMLQDEVGVIGDLLFQELDHNIGIVVLKFLSYWLDVTNPMIEEIESGEVPFPSASGVNFFDNRYTEELETRDELILSSLALALAEAAPLFEDLGADPDDLSTWRWGLYHSIRLDDEAAHVLPEASSARLEKPGALYTVNIADFVWLRDSALPELADVTNASSNRFVIEVRPGDIRGEWIIPGGQSEIPGDPHHNDLLQEYVDDEYRPMHFYRGDVEADTVETWSFAAGYPARGDVTRSR